MEDLPAVIVECDTKLDILKWLVRLGARWVDQWPVSPVAASTSPRQIHLPCSVLHILPFSSSRSPSQFPPHTKTPSAAACLSQGEPFNCDLRYCILLKYGKRVRYVYSENITYLPLTYFFSYIEANWRP